MESSTLKLEALLGVVTLSVIAGFIWLTFAVGGGAVRGAHRYDVILDSALGLTPDNEVAVAGVKVGVVEDIAVDGNHARLRIAVEPGVAIYEDGTITLRQRTLLGEKYLDLEPGTPTKPALAPGAVLDKNPGSVEVDEVMREAALLIERVNKLVAPLERVADAFGGTDANGNSEALSTTMVDTLKDLQTVLVDVSRLLKDHRGGIDKLLTTAEVRGVDFLERLDRTSGRLEAILAEVDPATLKKAVGSAGKAADDVAAMMTDLRGMSHDARGVPMRLERVLTQLERELNRMQAINEGAVREFLQLQGVRVNLFPDAAVKDRVLQLRDAPPPKPGATK